MRLLVCVGLLALGCAGTVDGAEEPTRSRPTDVVAETVVLPVAETVPEAVDLAPAVPEQEPAVAETAEPAVAVSQPLAPASEPTIAPVTAPANEPPAPGCVAVDGGWVCEPQTCEPEPPVPSAVDESGRMQGHTADGRQLCGGHVTDRCGFSYDLTQPCLGLDACGGEGVAEDGAPDEERFICAECRIDTDPVVAAARIDASHPVVLAGCQVQPGCVSFEVQGSDGRFRSYQFCAAVPAALR